MALKKGVDVKPAKGKLGILLPGMGAVATTFIAGVQAIRRGHRQADRLADPARAHPPRQADRRQLAGDQGLRLARQARRHRVRRLGHLPGQRLPGRGPAPACSRPSTSSRSRTSCEAIKPMTGGVRAGLRQEAERPQRQEGRDQDGPRRAGDGRHPRVQGDPRLRSPGRGVVRLDRGLPQAGRGPQHARQVRGRRCAARTTTSRRRRSTPTRASRWACRTPTARPTCRSTPRRCSSSPRRPGPAGRRQGLQDRPDPDEDDPRARLQGAHARPVGLVLDQHPGQPRRRGARRSRVVQEQGGLQARRARPHPPARSSTPSSTATSTHVVRINYYPPRGDNKEGWDNIDIFGWLGYPMQIKVNFLCRDSILAAPIVLDLALFMDFAQRAGMSGIQEWLSFYWKRPMTARGPLPRARPVHPAHEAEEHAALHQGRRADHPPRRRVLRLAG